MTTFNIGVVGAGDIARKIHLPVLLSMPNVRVSWLHDAEAARARATAEAFGLRAIAASQPHELPDCDVVLLAIPVGVREPYLRDFASRRIAVFCEKPFAISAAHHRRILELFPAHRLGCGYMRRFYRSTRIMHRLLGNNWLGPVKGIRFSEGGRARGSGAGQSFLDRADLAATRGVLMDLGSHGIDLALHLSSAQGFAVRASELTLDGDVDRRVCTQVMLQPAHAAPPIPFDCEVSWLDSPANRIELVFEDVSVWADIGPGSRVFMGSPARPEDAIELDASRDGASTANQAFFLEWQAFLAGVQAQAESMVSAASALPTTALVEEIRVRGLAGHA